jgi:hypothetical protein
MTKSKSESPPIDGDQDAHLHLANDLVQKLCEVINAASLAPASETDAALIALLFTIDEILGAVPCSECARELAESLRKNFARMLERHLREATRHVNHAVLLH